MQLYCICPPPSFPSLSFSSGFSFFLRGVCKNDATGLINLRLLGRIMGQSLPAEDLWAGISLTIKQGRGVAGPSGILGPWLTILPPRTDWPQSNCGDRITGSSITSCYGSALSGCELPWVANCIFASPLSSKKAKKAFSRSKQCAITPRVSGLALSGMVPEDMNPLALPKRYYWLRALTHCYSHIYYMLLLSLLQLPLLPHYMVYTTSFVCCLSPQWNMEPFVPRS